MANDNPELKALQDAIDLEKKKKELADAQKETASAQRKAATESVPAVTSKPLDGGTTLGEGTGYLAELVAYHALRKAAESAGTEVGAKLSAAAGAKVLIVDTLDLAAQRALFEVTKRQIQRASDALKAQKEANETLLEKIKAALAEEAKAGAESTAPKEQRPKALESMVGAGAVIATAPAVIGTVTAGVEALSALVGAAADVAAWFRGSYDIKTRAVSIKQRTAITLMAGAIAAYDVHIAGFQPQVKSKLLEDLDILIENRLALGKSAAKVSVLAAALKDEALKLLVKTAADLSATLTTAADETVKGLVTAPSADAQPPLGSALVAEQVCDGSYTHYLFVQVETSGGETVIEKKIWDSGRLTYMGGGVFSYVLAGREGRVLAAGNAPVFSELAVRKGSEPTALVDVKLPGLLITQ